VLANLLESLDNIAEELTAEHSIENVEVDGDQVNLTMNITPKTQMNVYTIDFKIDPKKECPLCRFEDVINELEDAQDDPEEP